MKQKDYIEVLPDCNAGEVVTVTVSCPIDTRFLTKKAYEEYLRSKYSVGPQEELNNDCRARYTVTSDGDWVLIVSPRSASTKPQISIERRKVDPYLWNEHHTDMKIVRKQPTPYGALIASTLGYWERNTGYTFNRTESCPICDAIFLREDARCALVTIPGQMPVQHYVVPVCPHCYEQANGKTFFFSPSVMCKAPK